MTDVAVLGLSDGPESMPAEAPSDARAPAPPEGLYLHIPFCVSQCPYCDFVVYAGSAARGPRNRVGPLVDALHAELDLRAELADGHFGPPEGGRAPLESLYLGGGTPSLLAASSVAALIEHAGRRFGLAPDAEVTLEANPGGDEIGDLAGFRAAGVNRLSIGAQSMDRAELRVLGRRHGPEDVAAAVRSARQAGLASVSLDLLTDTPGQSGEDWRRTLRRALDLGPDHLSVYALSLDDPDGEGLTGPDGDHLAVSRGARQWRDRARVRQSQDRAAEIDAITDELTMAAGLRRYEIANLARPGQESRHNRLYWRRRPYLGLGPGAHSSDGDRERRWNGARLDGYVDSLCPREAGAAPTLPPGGSDVVDAATARAESAILGLRLSEGLAADTAEDSTFAAGLAWADGEGLVESADGRVRLTKRGRALSNEIFMRLLPDVAETAEAASAK